MQRRQFLKQVGYAAGSGLVGLGANAWFARSQAATAASTGGKRLIVIFLRGAVDGLNLLVPHQESAYYAARPTIAIPQPGQPNGALDLDGQFGLHPQLQMLLPLWENKQMAIALNCGLPELTRSHFEAQDRMEIGTPGNLRTTDGWMNRLLGVLAPTDLASDENPIQAVNVGNAMPRILTGPAAIASLASGKVAERKLSLDQENISKAFDRLYARNDILGKTYQEARAAREALQAAVQAEAMEANNGAPPPQGFARDAQRLARIMNQDGRVQLAFFGLGGWDTHVNQGASQGQLARNLRQLGEGLVALKAGLGAQFGQTAIVVMSEFGRTLKENGNGGTDHGRGNVMLLLGGNLPGGRLYGDWAGLGRLATPSSEGSQLNENRDLPVTTDFRDVLARTLETQMGLNDAQLAQVFPNHSPTSRLW